MHKPTLVRRGYFPFLPANVSDLRSALYRFGKPVVLAAFGLVTQDNLLQYVPVNSTCPAVKLQQNQKRKSCCTTAPDQVFV